jgi:hypothetical protein
MRQWPLVIEFDGGAGAGGQWMTRFPSLSAHLAEVCREKRESLPVSKSEKEPATPQKIKSG